MGYIKQVCDINLFVLKNLKKVAFGASTIIITSFILLNNRMPQNAGAIGPYLNSKLPSTNSNWKTDPAFTGLDFDLPIWVREFPNRDAFFLTTKNGQIWLIEKGEDYQKSLALDISGQVFSESDAGMFDLAFHPEFADESSSNRGYVYVMYNYLPAELNNEASNPNNKAYYRLSRFHFDFETEAISVDSELVLIQQFDRNWWHTGGALFFDNAGFLNFSVGDEGGNNDEFGNGQDISQRLFGGIFRIDVDRRFGVSHEIRRYPTPPADIPDGWPSEINAHYNIPNGNPWVSLQNDWLEEYYVMGLRSPHTTYYDSIQDEIWVADVGQGQREEISVFKKGDNGQWPFKEGTIDGPKARPTEVLGNEVAPIYDYERTQGKSVIGGYIYRGAKYPELQGKYIFGDFDSQGIWSLDPETKDVQSLARSTGKFVSFAEARDGEIYIIQIYDPGMILSLNPPDETTISAPMRLSQVGAFLNLSTLQPIRGLIPYELNTELYSDGAIKRRWIAVPNDGVYNTPDEQIVFGEINDWKYPEGTVLIKHFELPVSTNDPGMTKRLETRFFVVKENGSYGLTYKWNDTGTEAYLLNNAESKDFSVLKDDQYEVQTWHYPGRSQCLSCHNANAGHVLGLSSHNMNKAIQSEGGNQEINQLISWTVLGLFTEELTTDYINNLSATVSLQDAASDNELKVRSYVDVNCSFCHRPNGVEETNFDSRFSVPLSEQNIVGSPTTSRNSISTNFIIKIGDTLKSEMYRRIHEAGDLKMPPLGRNLVDDEFAETLRNWIMGIENTVTSVEQINETSFTIFPNPVKDYFNIQLPQPFSSSEYVIIKIIALNGQEVYSNELKSNHQVRVWNTLSSGIYIVNVTSGNGFRLSERIVVSR